MGHRRRPGDPQGGGRQRGDARRCAFPLRQARLPHPGLHRPRADVTELLPPAALDRAAALLREGKLVAFPTETVYGLGGNAANESAVAAIFAAKERPQFNPLIVHVPDLAAAEKLAALDTRARALAQKFWPGPLTLVLQRA